MLQSVIHLKHGFTIGFLMNTTTPKTYSDFVNEIDSAGLLSGLLGYGLFDEKLPPAFSSKQFCEYFVSKKPGFRNKARGFATYQCIRHTGGMRIMGIPHALSYANLCNCLSTHWDKIGDRLKANTQGQLHKVSRIHLRKKSGDGLFKMNYFNWDQDGDPLPAMQIGARYQVDTDIAQFFPSVYSHAVSWALVGKQEAKRKRSSNIWYNSIDKALSNCTNGETHGILIGPHASNLIAEVIITSCNGTCSEASVMRSGHRHPLRAPAPITSRRHP